MLSVEKISDLIKQHRFRTRTLLEDRDHNNIQINAKGFVDFTSSDYLALSKHPIVTKAYKDALDKYGFGSLASPIISGYYKIHQRLEEKICERLNLDRAILFNSGYTANLAMLSACLERKNIILSDKLNHISILQGIQLTNAKMFRYPHNNLEALKQLIEAHAPQFIVTESVFSMDGDVTPIEKIMKIAVQHKIKVFIDHAHGFGWADEIIKPNTELTSISMSKAMSSMGGAVVGRDVAIEHILQFAKTYQYSTSLSPVVAAGLIATLTLLEKEYWRQKKLIENIQQFNQLAKERGIQLISDDITPIRSILIGDDQKVILLQERLKKYGLFVAAIRTPSVPKDTARLRVTLNCHHDSEEIKQLMDILSE